MTSGSPQAPKEAKSEHTNIPPATLEKLKEVLKKVVEKVEEIKEEGVSRELSLAFTNLELTFFYLQSHIENEHPEATK